MGTVTNARINERVLSEVARQYDLDEKDVLMLLKSYSKYLYHHINKLDLSKDLSEQQTRFVIPNVGVIYIGRIFILENNLKYGHLTRQQHGWCKTWFSNAYKVMSYRVEKFKKIINLKI